MIDDFFITKNIPILDPSNFNIVGIEKFIRIIIEWLKKFLRAKIWIFKIRKNSLPILKEDNFFQVWIW